MTLSIQVVDRLFTRLSATYGAAWDRSMGQAPITDVKTAWAHELQGFSGQLEAMAWALENLPERCPNVIEFRNLCRRAPATDTPRLPEPKADPERVREELQKLGGMRQVIAAQPRANTAWADAIVCRAKAGERISPTVLRMAEDVTGRRARLDGEVIDV